MNNLPLSTLVDIITRPCPDYAMAERVVAARAELDRRFPVEVDRRTLDCFTYAQAGDDVEICLSGGWLTGKVVKRAAEHDGICIDVAIRPPFTDANAGIRREQDIRWPKPEAPAFDRAAWVKGLKPGDRIMYRSGDLGAFVTRDGDEIWWRADDRNYDTHARASSFGPIQGAKAEPDFAATVAAGERDASAAREAEIVSLRETIAAKDAQIETDAAAISDRDKIIAAKDAEIAKYIDGLNHEQQVIRDQEKTITELRAALARSSDEINRDRSGFDCVLTGRDKTIAELQAECANRYNTIATLRAQLETERATVAVLRSGDWDAVRRTLGATSQEYTNDAARRVVDERTAAIHEAQDREKELEAVRAASEGDAAIVEAVRSHPRGQFLRSIGDDLCGDSYPETGAWIGRIADALEGKAVGR